DALKAELITVEKDLIFFGRETRPIHKSLASTTNPFIPDISGREDKSVELLVSLNIKLKDGEKWRALRDLSEEEKRTLCSAIADHLLSKGLHYEIENLIGKVDYEVKETVKHKDVKEVNELKEDLAQILGYFVGNGSKDFYNNSVRIRDEKKEILEFYNSLFKNVFNIKPKILKVKGCFELEFANKYVADVLRFLIKNIYGLFLERKNIIKAFLKGLFDAEGSINSMVNLRMKDKEFLVFVKLLLLRLGIHSTISPIQNKYGIYRLMVNPNKFKKIGFTSSEKNKKLESKKLRKEERVPLKRKKLIELLKEMGIDYNFKHPENRISYSELAELCRKYEEVNKIFGSLIALNFEKIYSIKKLQNIQKLIDIETGCANFLVNGYLVHNSTYRIYLRRGKEGTRIARLVDAPDLPEGECVFKITENGLKDP
ncbi:MAG: LAGLIDADG family homing endonuclease, partial [Candidatus Aenigmatarchaeota archaeon]